MSQLEKNKHAAQALLDLLYDSNKSSQERAAHITDYINPDKYIQHSPTLDNGHQALLDLSDKFEREYDCFSVNVVRLIAEGDFVVAHCHYKFGTADEGKAIVEIFRFEDSKMVEHWDVMQDVTDQSVNGNSMF